MHEAGLVYQKEVGLNNIKIALHLDTN